MDDPFEFWSQPYDWPRWLRRLSILTAPVFWPLWVLSWIVILFLTVPLALICIGASKVFDLWTAP